MKYIFILLALSLPFTSFAHAGKLNADGCHNNKKAGQYECHGIEIKDAKRTAKLSVKSSAKQSSRGDYNCADFASQNEAQKMFVKAGGPKLDPYDLDRDHDGKACETLN